MDDFLKSILWAQFSAALDMLENAIRACPDALWPLPDRPYAKDELLAYLDHGRRKCPAAIEGLTGENARDRRVFGQQTGSAPRWVKQALP